MKMKLGIAQSLVPPDPSELTRERASEIATLGIATIMTHFRVPPTQLTGGDGRRLAAMLAEEGLTITACAGLRPNLVSDNDALRASSVEDLKQLILAAKSMGATMINAGCGSHHPTHNYGPHAENHSETSRTRLVACLREIAPSAEDAEVIVAMEPHVRTTLNTPTNVRSILDEVDSPYVRSNYDPVNFLGSLDDVFGWSACAPRALATLGDRAAPCAHIKDVALSMDFVLHIAEAVPGEGEVDLAVVLEACQQLPECSTLFIEHLTAEQLPRAVAHVAGLAASAGLELDRGPKFDADASLESRV
jgi:sugar phosphate isomerase/epimerase